MQIGSEKSIEARVTPQMTALAVKSGDAPVLATPMMVALMEQAAMELAAQFLPEGKTTVGTALSITHTAATPVGMEITATAVLTEALGKSITFHLTATDRAGAIGEGTHTRAIVDRQRFIQRAEEKNNQ